MDSLLCEEELITSPSRDYEFQTPEPFFSTNEDRENAFKICLEKEPSFLLEAGYLQHIKSKQLLQARFKAVKWMIKTQQRLNLSLGTIFDSVNYFDRFISKNRSKNWVIELLSVACLSIAVKSNEVCIPTLLELQVEGLEFLFKGSTIQHMELTILKALSWRLKCATAYSMVELLIGRLDALDSRLHAALTACVTELLVATLLDPKFLEFRHSSIAVAAFTCAVEELLPLKSNSYLSDLTHLMPEDQMAEIQRCYNCMEDRVVDPPCCLVSPAFSPRGPVTVHCPLDFSRVDIFDSSLDFGFSLYKIAAASRKRKWRDW